MLTEYIEEALKRGSYEIIEDEERYYGEIRELRGVWATGKTLEECRSNLKEVVEGWILLSVKKSLPIPKLGDVEIKEREEAANQYQILADQCESVSKEEMLDTDCHRFIMIKNLEPKQCIKNNLWEVIVCPQQ